MFEKNMAYVTMPFTTMFGAVNDALASYAKYFFYSLWLLCLVNAVLMEFFL